MQEPYIELQSSRMWQYLNDLDAEYAQKAITIVKGVSPILASINTIFPFYTRHDAHHGFKVLQRMSAIVQPDCFSKDSAIAFTKEEALLLIAAAYAHDLGMAVFPEEQNYLRHLLHLENSEDWLTDKNLQKYLRDHHSQRGGSYIADNAEKLGIPRNLIDLLHKIMKAHNMLVDEMEKELGQRQAAGEREIDLKQLACILCIADALEFSDTRVLDGVIDELRRKLTTERNEEYLVSLRENLKNLGIGSGAGIGGDGKIIFSGTFEDPEILNLAYKTIDLIEEWVKNYTDIDYQSKVRRLNLRSDSIATSLTIFNHDFERLGVRIKKDNIIDLLSSNSMWTREKTIVLRELLQNAVESCRYRKFKSSEADDYKPFIEVRAEDNGRKIIVSDNGCGMSRNVILNNFLTIGNSRSLEPHYVSNRFHSLARFGIGFWSVFTIADYVTVESAPFEYQDDKSNQVVSGLSFDVSTHQMKDYTVFKRVPMSPGTRVVLHLKENISADDALGNLDYHIACSEIPLTVTNGNATSQVPSNIDFPSFAVVFGSRYKPALQYGITHFDYTIGNEHLDLKLRLFYRTENGKPTFRLPDNAGMFSLKRDFDLMHRSVSICGFLSNFGFSEVLLPITNCAALKVDVKNPEGYSFTLNRLSLIKNEKTDELTILINYHIYEAFRRFLKENNCYNEEDIYRLTTELKLNVDGNFGIHNKAILTKVLDDAGDLLYVQLAKVDKNVTLATAPKRLVRLVELSRQKLNIWKTHRGIQLNFPREITENKNLEYQIVKAIPAVDENSYFIENDKDFRYFQESDPTLTALSLPISIPNVGTFSLPCVQYHTDNIDFMAEPKWKIGHVQGIWTGTIEERNLIGAAFIFLSTQHLLVQKGGQLAADIKDLIEKKQTHKTCRLVKLLQDGAEGFIDPSVAKYFENGPM